jgi:peptidyl-prolyl cis-trans isomerase D
MLQAIREKTSGWIAYLIIGLISVPFALWGINSYLGGGAEKPAAIVNGDEITPRQLDAAYARYRDQLASIFGGRIPAALNDENALKEQALTQLIEQKVLINYIKDKGYRIGDKKLFEIIQSMQVFQENGKFNREVYQQQLASQGYPPAYFEQELRQSTEMQQLNQAIKASAFTIPAQLEKLNQLQNEERKIRVLTFKNKAGSVTVDEQEIKDYYKNNSSLFMQPEKVKVDYIELSLDKIAKNISISEDQIRDKYDQTLDQMTTPETRTASHILLTVDEGADDEAVKQKIVDLKKRIEGGADFAAVAKEFSQDPGSAGEGGELGEIERGAMVPPFETALFALQPGDISDPVKTQFGWHIIKLNSVQGGKTKPFEDARNEIENELKAEKAESQIYDLAENLASIAYEEPSSLQPAADQLDLNIDSTDWFTRNQGSDIAAEEKVREAAFSDEVLSQKINSELIELSDNRVVIVHIKDHQPAAAKPLSDVRDQIVAELKKRKGTEIAETEGKKALQQLKSGEKSLDELAAELSIKVNDAGYLKRNDTKLGRDLLSAAFTMSRPENGKPVYGAVSQVTGDYSILELSDVRIAKSSEDKKSDDELVTKLNGAKANYEYQALIQSLTDEADIMRTPVKELQ